MLGDSLREARIRKGLTQARLARLAGVSRRHLAALEKGANVSVLVLRKVAAVLDLREIQLGDISLRGDNATASVNVALLTDSIREARAGAARTEAILSRAEGILTSESGQRPVPSGQPVTAMFPPMPVRHLDLTAPAGATRDGDLLHDAGGDWLEIRTAGELRQGVAVDESKKESIVMPASLIEQGELVFRARGEKLRAQGIEDGDLLVVQLRTAGRAATGELTIARIGDETYVGRWWQKNGRKALMSDGLAEVTVGKTTRQMKVVAVVNQIIRPKRR